MVTSRAFRLVVVASFLRLIWAGVAPACETHEEAAPRGAPASHAAHDHTGGASAVGDARVPHESPAPAGVPVCCALMTVCTGLGMDAVNTALSTSGVGRSRVIATPTPAPDSRIVAPEPPPPKQ